MKKSRVEKSELEDGEMRDSVVEAEENKTLESDYFDSFNKC